MQKGKMNSYERISATLNHEEPDLVPWTGPTGIATARSAGIPPDQYAKDGEKMAKSQITFHEKYLIDGMWVFSDVGYHAEGFGSRVKFVGDVEVTPYIQSYPVEDPVQYEKLQPYDPEKQSRIPVVLKALDIIKSKYGDTVAYGPYVASPMTTVTHVRKMDKVMMDVIQYPDLLHKALNLCTDQWIENCKALIGHGSNIIWHAVTRGTAEVLELGQYLEFGWPYEEKLEKAIKRIYPDIFIVEHCCGRNPHLDVEVRHTAEGYNYWDRCPARSGVTGEIVDIKYFKVKWGEQKSVVAGLDQTKSLLIGDPEDVMAEARDAILNGAKGGGFILAPGCEYAVMTEEENLKAISRATYKWKYPIDM
jgi:uroporphyrinogen decarboxylase